MKRFTLIFLLAAVSAFGAFTVTHWIRRSEAMPDEMTWMQREFALSPDQIATIRKLQSDYDPICADHCRRIAEARVELERLENAGLKQGAEHDAAIARWNELKRECNEATRRHVETVAAAMSPGQGKRFLQLIKPKLGADKHDRPFSLR